MRADKTSGHWFAAQLKPNGLGAARRNLARQGFEIFAPTETFTQRAGSRFQPKTRLLFPGYLFVKLDLQKDGWRRVHSTIGVVRLVQAGDQPISLPHDLIEALRQRCDGDASLIEDRMLSAGDRVRMVSGPFCEFLAEVEQADSDGRIFLLINLMERQVRVTTSKDHVSTAGG